MESSLHRALLYVSIVIVSISCSALLFTPYGGDDIINHSVWPNLGFSGVNIFASDLTAKWLTGQGRFFPTAIFWMAYVFFFLRDIFAYKLFLLSLLSLQFILQIFWLRRLNNASPNQSFILILSFGTCAWVGAWPSLYNPFNSFHGMFMLSGCLGIGLQLIWLSSRLSLRSKTFLAALIAMLAITLYELNLIFLLALLFIPSDATDSDKHRPRAALLCIAALLYFLLLRLFHSHIGVSAISKYQLSLSTFSFSAFAEQLIAPFADPLTNVLHYENGPRLIILLAIASFACSLMYWRGDSKCPHKMPDIPLFRYYIFTSSLLMVMPPLLLASQRYWQASYQDEGVYLYIYYQLLGLSVLICSSYQYFTTKLPCTRIILSSVLVFSFLTTFVVNIHSVQAFLPGPRAPMPKHLCKNLPYQC
jgi:hypothetical protein